ncbi:MAG TPA: 1-deoxy-D-xylulose-5-phosphate reductoisomerase [bacterium]|nr:1-deoxy-D-xylulose-5-phosphate reductoisomerase [bacterium]
MKRVAVIGSTGSIGENTLKVVAAAPERFEIVGLAAGTNYRRLAEQISAHQPQVVSVCTEHEAGPLCALIGPDGPEVVSGEEGLCKVATIPEADVVVIAVAGAAALAPALAAVNAGKTVALANKECLVMAGGLIMEAAKKSGATILPVDSEHAAIFQALAGRPVAQVKRIILPASGGPFLDTPPPELERVTPEQAVKHPTWPMGRKISVDSATLMNKALEIIEAHWLFGLPPEKIEVVIHPEAIIHGMVEFDDGSVVAQMSVPDMRLPILHALAWPERIAAGMPRLDLPELGRLTFRRLDPSRFPAPGLAYQALKMGGDAPAVLAAADEAAIAAFLSGRIPFTRIVPLVASVLDSHTPAPVTTIQDTKRADARAREQVRRAIQ